MLFGEFNIKISTRTYIKEYRFYEFKKEDKNENE